MGSPLVVLSSPLADRCISLKPSLKKKFIFMEKIHNLRYQNILLALFDTKLKTLVISLFLRVSQILVEYLENYYYKNINE